MESNRSSRRRRRESTSSDSSSSTYDSLRARMLQNLPTERASESERVAATSLTGDQLLPTIFALNRPAHLYFALRRSSTAPTTTTATTPRSPRPSQSQASPANSTAMSSNSTVTDSISTAPTGVSATSSSSSPTATRTRPYSPTRLISPSSEEKPSKRRRIVGRTGGQVEPKKLQLVIVDPDSHTVEGNSDRRNSVHNILNEDNSSYTFPLKPLGTPTILRFTLPGTEPHSFTLTRLIVEGVFTNARYAPRALTFIEGLVYISYELRTFDKSCAEYVLTNADTSDPYSDDEDDPNHPSDDSDDEDFLPDPPILRDGTEIKNTTSFEVFEDYSKLEEKQPEKKYAESEVPRAKVFIGKRKTKCEVVFEPELSGAFLELRLYTHRRNAPLKIKYIGAWGYDSTRCFPMKSTNNGEFVRVY
ncbi:hypothetical protein BJ508DRAFT_417112 [Ascobolus immersus RN42]|uniref:Uncharacterized protein n=1 Tax=Ascobolus immersus RN42 TaxID=1160509 RepID=A0A3N4HUC6_ASCIM|nr:hypothetical protein BJ508DRAFT_417112 [Ascobolus immersus RN42]